MKIMKKYVFVCLACFIASSAKAQFDDTMMLNQWLNQMNMDFYQQQKEMGKQLMDVINQGMKRQKENANAVCSIFPNGSSDIFFAYISMCYLSPNELEIVKRMPNCLDEILPSSFYMAYMGVIVTSSVFVPGTTVIVRNRDTQKVYSKISIPVKGSSEYDTFVINARIMLNNMNSSNSSSGRSYDQIQYDIDKAYKRLGDMERNKSHLKDNSVLHPSYDRMIQGEKQRIEDLKRERNRAR